MLFVQAYTLRGYHSIFLLSIATINTNSYSTLLLKFCALK